MRSKIALTTGLLLGATAGLACLFVMKSPGHVRTASLAAAHAKKAAAAKVSPERVASSAARTGAASEKAAARSAAALAAATNDLKALARLRAGNRVMGTTAGKKAARKALALVKVHGAGVGASAQPAAGTVAAADGAQDVASRIAANAEARRDNAVMRGVSGFVVGVDLRHPISGPSMRLAAVPSGLGKARAGVAPKPVESAQ